jgi:hypothetical protein
MSTEKWVLLVEVPSGDTVAVGNFASQDAARKYEEDCPWVEVVGCVRLMGPTSLMREVRGA